MYSTVITRTRVHLATWSEFGLRRRDRLQRKHGESTTSSQSKAGQPLQSIKVKASRSLIEEETAHVPSFQNSKKKKEEKTQLPNCHSRPNQSEAGGYWNRKALCFFAFRVFQKSSELRKLGK